MEKIPFVRLIIIFLVIAVLMGFFFPPLGVVAGFAAAVCGIGLVIKILFFRS